MDSNDGLRSLQLPAGSKRSSLTPFDEEGREAKKHRTQAGDDAEQRVIPVGSAVPFPLVDLPLADPFSNYSGLSAESWGGNTAHETLSNNATNSDLGYGDQYGVLSYQDVGYGGNFGNQLEIAYADQPLGMDFIWDLTLQHPYQDNQFNIDPNSGLDLGFQFSSIRNDGFPPSIHDAPEEVGEDNAGSHAIHSQVHDTSLQDQPAPVLSQDHEVCYDYDTCLGVVSQVLSATHRSL